jgi:hypothetical protein
MFFRCSSTGTEKEEGKLVKKVKCCTVKKKLNISKKC